MYLLQCCIFNVIVSVVIFVLRRQVKVDVVVAHNRHVLFPDLSNRVFDKNDSDLGSPCLDLGLLSYTQGGSRFLSLLGLTKAVPDLHDTFV